MCVHLEVLLTLAMDLWVDLNIFEEFDIIIFAHVSQCFTVTCFLLMN